MDNFSVTSISASQVGKLDVCRAGLIDQVSTVRRALDALNLDSPKESSEAFLQLVDEKLNRIERRIDKEMKPITGWCVKNL
ncbi:hypothetical protein [uncultured Microbulbifer sp.]|uniref:hypothetical protein n=1 Tax=uncultured Microbulbifer sp. TaxID=348147 RepID=UPI0026073ECF|nr:hypothetical protein [uncultured Microbulbifer sp.]